MKTMATSVEFIYLPFFIFFCFASIPSTFSSNQTDLLALLAFKDAVDDPLRALSSWNKTLDLCGWKGISCDNDSRVFSIDLRSQGLVGSLSPHIGNMSFLLAINLQNNSFHGQIPQEISRLRSLEFVNFSNNTFVGPIPKNLSQCKNLEYLNLIDNNLSGTIPHELGFLYKLQVLGLGSNSFPGPIPPFIGNLTSLTILGLTRRDLKGEIPESLARLQRLQLLALSVNSLTGTIPPGLFNISTLVMFLVSLNQLRGTIPSNIGITLPNLRILQLAENQFTGRVPTSLRNATMLREIMFLMNYFTGPMPRVGELSHREQFGFAENPIEDDISFISSLTNCTNLRRLEVGENLLSGSLPGSIANLSSRLESFMILSTDIHGIIPSGIGNLVSLTRFSLGNNNLEGPIPLGIGKLTNVRRLNLGNNRFQFELPSSFGNLSLLNELHLERNNFSGTIPKSLGNCTKLLELDLSHNNLNGSIPPEIMSLSSVSISLLLSYNSLTGLIPLEVGSLTNLGYLGLSNNRLSGPIPNTLKSCLSLQHLDLEGNLLQGEIPLGLSFLTGLQDLDLSRNNLSGSIPSFLGELHLQKLNLSFNRFSGQVPTLGVFGNRRAIFLEGNNELCGGIIGLKLPPCPLIRSKKNHISTLLKVLIPSLVVGGICLVCLITFLIYRRRKATKILSSPPSFTMMHFLRLSYADLLKATGGFSDTNLVGVGRFGSVYKGILGDGHTLVAVKVLHHVVQGAFKSFMTECKALRGIRHRNLLKILSICESIDFKGNDFKALVYEFKANGSLDKWLYRNSEQDKESGEESRSLTMSQRLNIAIDIAHALEYLHFGTESPIVHGDLKPANILLDNDMVAYVGDFGLAKVLSSTVQTDGQSSSSIGIRGTIGYVAPEYGTSDLVSTQADVYSYGILLLEVFTNRRPTDDSFKDNVNLHNFVSAALPHRVTDIMYPHILEGHNMNEYDKIKSCVASILSIGVACSEEMPRDRKTMTDVVSELHKIKNSYLQD